jgi:hypothetical protein
MAIINWGKGLTEKQKLESEKRRKNTLKKSAKAGFQTKLKKDKKLKESVEKKKREIAKLKMRKKRKEEAGKPLRSSFASTASRKKNSKNKVKSSVKKTKPEILTEKEIALKEILVKENNLLDEMARYKKNNLIEFFTRPNPMQKKLLKAWDDPTFKVFVFTGGNRIGKTTIGVILAISFSIGYWPWDVDKPFVKTHSKPFKIRYVGQDWEKQIKSVVIPELVKWWPKKEKVKKKKNNVGVEALWTHERTGSTIEIMSNLQSSELHEGWKGDLVIYDEPPRRDIRVANARGLVDREGRELFCMTLLKEAWVDREVIRAKLPDGTIDPTVFSIKGTIYENIGYGITENGVEQFSKTLTEDEKAARLMGVPSYMSGLVYKRFSRDKHIIEAFKIPLDWPVDVSIDVHPRTEQAILFCATSPFGFKYVVDEIWCNGDGKFIGEEIIRVANRRQYRINRVIIDPLSKADGNNQSTVFEKVQKVLWAYNYCLETASKEKTSGILLVKDHLYGVNKQPSLFIFQRCVRFLFEIEGYMYDKKTQKPVDKDDHMMENLYRLLLLNTVYTEKEYEGSGDSEEETLSSGRDEISGY